MQQPTLQSVLLLCALVGACAPPNASEPTSLPVVLEVDADGGAQRDAQAFSPDAGVGADDAGPVAELDASSGDDSGAPAIGLAFPGAEGFGRYARGGRGGQVIKVTSLADDGPGSLRAALSASGPRIVVFDTGGTIALVRPIEITNPYLTIAGQTAPGGGIQVRDANLIIATHDVILRGMRLRVGDDYANGLLGGARDSLSLGSMRDSNAVYNVMIDHNSIEWGIDECVGLQDSHDVSFQYNIVGETMYRNQHPDGPHSRGFMISAFTPGATHHVSVHHNLLIHSKERNPNVDENSEATIENNLIYDYGTRATHVKGRADVFANHYIPGPSTRSVSEAPILAQIACMPTWCTEPLVWAEGNMGPGRPDDSGSEWLAVRCGDPADQPWCVAESYKATGPLTAASGVTRDPASAVYQRVLDGAGALAPARDALDLRLIGDVTSGGGQLKDCIVTCDGDDVDAGDWPLLEVGTAPPDGDGDGMPDAWELANGTDPARDDAAEDLDQDGYSNIEVYIDSLLR